MNSNSKLSKLPIDKTSIFYSPIQGKQVLVRTGIEKNNSLIHACLLAFTEDYARMDEKRRYKIAEKLYIKLSEKVLEKKWQDTFNTPMGQVNFQFKIISLFKEIYQFILQNKKCKSTQAQHICSEIEQHKEVFSIIFELLPLIELTKTILPKIFDVTKKEINIENVKEVITQNLTDELKKRLKKISDEKKNYCIGKLEKICLSVIGEAERFSYRFFCNSFKEKGIDIDFNFIETISDHFNCDIFFLHTNRLPINPFPKTQTKNRDSIVLLRLTNSQYELIGKILEEDTEYVFKPTDSIIKCIKTFLYNEKELSENYPELSEYKLSGKTLSTGSSSSDESF